MQIKRIDGYDDSRFPQKALRQHGAFEADGEPVWIEIVSQHEAVVHGACSAELIDEFRFFAGHISVFFDDAGAKIAQFPQVELFDVELSSIQPSQFYVDEEKLRAVREFVRTGADVIVPLMEKDGRYISLDGHTRMYAAHEMGALRVKGFISTADESIFDFAAEAQRRGIYAPADMTLLSHAEYCIKWHKYCDEFFANR